MWCLKYKSEDHGKHLIEVDRYFPSTKKCSGCGQQREMNLEERIYRCSNCDLEMDRDENSAINIKAAGMSVVNACGVARWSDDEARIFRL